MKQTLGDLVESAAATMPAGLAIVDPLRERTLTWRELAAHSSVVAGWLRGQGLRKGDRVLLLLDEQAETIVSHVAIARAGLVAVPVSYRLKADEIERICATVDPAAIVFAEELSERAVATFDHLSGAGVKVVVGGPSSGVTTWADVLVSDATPMVDDAQPDDLVVLGFTSGTTGQPKPIPLEQRAVREGARRGALAYGLPLYGTAIMTASMTFLAAITTHLWAHLWMRSTIVLVGRYDLKRQFELVEQYGGTFTYVPTPAIRDATELLRARPEAASSLHVINLGGSILPPDDVRDLVGVAGDCVVATYGLSEGTGAPLCRAGTREWAEAGWQSAGRPVPPTVLEIVDAEGNALPMNGETVGELRARVDTTMRSADDGGPVAGDWLLTGDLASIDENGYVTIRGRSRDVIISGGINVYPAEVERVLSAAPGLRECAVIGAPDARWGETVVAFIVAAEDAPDGELSVMVADYVKERLATYKCPTRYVVVPELPRNSNGKVVKSELAEIGR